MPARAIEVRGSTVQLDRSAVSLDHFYWGLLKRYYAYFLWLEVLQRAADVIHGSGGRSQQESWFAYLEGSPKY